MPLEEVEIEIDKSVYLECYQHLLQDDDIDIELIWGGRDSGKSHFAAQINTEYCLSLPYFRCLLVKETHEAIRDSQVAMLEEVVEDWELSELFSFVKQPLEIRCANKNKFLSRGTDKPKKLRSITNPSHVWIEEGNQLTEVAFITLLTSLRNKYGKIKMIITFNPESDCADYIEHFLFKMFFLNHYPQQLSFTDEIKIDVPGEDPVILKFRSTHTTYHDNPFVSSQRKAFHEALKNMNYHWYTVFTLGLWGNQENDSPWAFAFDRKKHVAPQELFADHRYHLILSFDFNRNPAVCSIIQDTGTVENIIETIKIPKSGTDEICDQILIKYPNFVYIATGDYSGNTASEYYAEEVSGFIIIKNKLKLNRNQIQIVPNPKLKDNQTLVNYWLYHSNIQFCPVKAKAAIYDMEKVKKRADGTILKNDRDDPTQQADALDTIRYYVNKFKSHLIKK